MKLPSLPTKVEPKAMFKVQNWHRAYGEALLGTDSSKLPALVAVAKQEILARHLEVITSPARSDEDRDLQAAALALSQLNK